HRDFGTVSDVTGRWDGIPYNVVVATTPKIPLHVTRYAAESDTPPVSGLAYDTFTIIEGDTPTLTSPPPLPGDRHCILVDVSSHALYETFATTRDIVGASTVSYTAEGY